MILTGPELRALERVERASRELQAAQLELASLLDPDDAEARAVVLHADDGGPRLRVINGGAR